MRKNSKVIIVISIIFALVITCLVLAYLFFMTDVLKNKEELFAKYFMQNTETYQKIMDIESLNVIENLSNQAKYQSNMNIKMTHSEGGEISNSINNFSAKLDVEKNSDEQYMYADAQMMYADEKCFEVELIKDQDLYGIKFPDISRKFVTVQNDEKLGVIASDIGIDAVYLEILMNILDENLQTISKEQIVELKDKYLNIITSGLSKGEFKTQKNALITYNDVTTKTNAYSVSLSSEQVGTLLIELLNNLKSETDILNKIGEIAETEKIENSINETIKNINESLDIPAIKITVYEQKQQTIRTILEIGTHKLVLENVEDNGEIKSNISYVNGDGTIHYSIKINTDDKEKFQIITDVIDGKEKYTITFSSEMNKTDNQMNINTEISHKQDITTKSITLENKIITGEDFERKQTLALNDYVLLNTLDDATRQQFIATLKERVPQKLDEKIGGHIEQEPEDIEDEEQTSQAEINKFNAKFEFYTGEEVSEENVKKLLDIVKNNIIGHGITTVEDANATSGGPKTKKMMTIYIEKDKTNEESMTKILENIEKNKKYKISILYKESNGLIDYISITEI